jgi:hypothetical protein
MHGRTPILASIATLVALALPAGAGAVTFGADLNGASDGTGTCSSLFGPSATSCMFFSGAAGPVFYAPASGTVTAVRVKGGSVGGRMQVVVMRSLYQNRAGDPGHPYFACCFVEQYGPVFDVPANGIGGASTSLPMIEDSTPPSNDFTTNARGDFLALSVLAPNVPIPASFDNASYGSGYVPAPSPQTTPAPSPNPIFSSATSFGYHIMMSADINAGGGGGTIRPLTIPTGGSLIGSTAAIPLKCVLTTTCDGTLKLTDQTTGLRAAKAKKINVYGSVRFSIKAGKKKTVKVSLNRAGKAKLGRHSSITLTASATIAKKTYSSRVKFKRPAKRR